MRSEKRGEYNYPQECSYGMWCRITWGSRNIGCELRKEVNRTVLRSVHMACDAELVEKVETLDAKWEKRWIELSSGVFIWHAMSNYLRKPKQCMRSKKRAEQNCADDSSYCMRCRINWGSRNIGCQVKKEVNWTFVRSVQMACNVELVEVVETLDAKWEKR
jgi:hypothetical protein